MSIIPKKQLQKLRQIFYIILYKVACKLNKQEDNYVLFLSSSRDSMSGNFKFVSNEIKKRKKYVINSVLKEKLQKRYTLKQKFKLIKLIAISKYIFLDDFYPLVYALKLRKGTELIQLWHAMGAFKTVGYSRAGRDPVQSRKSLTHRNYTGTIVSSENIRKDYADAFGISIDKVHALGVPRTDIFFDKNYASKTKNELYKKYPKLKNKKIILFAPTFRGHGQTNAFYDFDLFDFEKFEKTFSKDYVCIVKLHPFIKNRPEYDFKNSSFYFDFTSEREINNLLFITDILITDYSSVIFEYSFFNKPVVFYVPDMQDYIDSRDFYYPFEKYAYGSVADNFEELIKKVKNAKVDEKKVEEFKEYFCPSCDGNSTKKVVDYFLGETK